MQYVQATYVRKSLDVDAEIAPWPKNRRGLSAFMNSYFSFRTGNQNGLSRSWSKSPLQGVHAVPRPRLCQLHYPLFSIACPLHDLSPA